MRDRGLGDHSGYIQMHKAGVRTLRPKFKLHVLLLLLSFLPSSEGFAVVVM